MFYVPSFIGGTLIGGTVAFIFLGALKRIGMLSKMQRKLKGEEGTNNVIEA